MGETETTTVTETVDNQNQGGAENQENLTHEQLIEELARARAEAAQANADRERYKNSVDDLTKKNKNLTQAVRERMTADEAAKAAKSEAEAAKDARIEELETKFRMIDYSKKYMGVGMDEKSATEIAELTGEIADTDKFFAALDKFVKAAVKKGSEDYVQTLIKNGGSIKAGNGDADKKSEAVRIAEESAARRANKGFNSEALKQWM